MTTINPYIPARLRRSIIFFLVMVATGLGLFLLIFPSPDLSQQELDLLRRISQITPRLQHAERVNVQHRSELQSLLAEFTQVVKLLKEDSKHMDFNDRSKSAVDQLLAANSGRVGHNHGLGHAAEAMLRGSTNLTFDLSLPGIHQFLPHTVNSPRAFMPAYKLAGRNQRHHVSMIMGVPTVKRDHQSYLSVTLKSIFQHLGDEEEAANTLVIVFVAETDVEYVKSVADELRQQFPDELNSGLLELISPPPEFYPDLSNLRQTLGDDVNRVQWRSKQNLDYAFLMMYAQSRGVYYVQLEDDILTKPKFGTIMREYAIEKSLARDDWFVIDYCQLGFIGKLFRTADLPLLVDFFLMFYNDKPGDWLLQDVIQTRACKLDSDPKKCRKEKARYWIHYKPSLFQHIGTHSSLKGKVQKLKDKQFGRISMFVPHTNPTAKIDTKIKHYKAFSMTRAYNGETFYWGLVPQSGDTIVIHLTPPQKLTGFKFVSGNAEHPSDRFVDTDVELMFSEGGEIPVPAELPRTEDGFVVVGSFGSQDGVARGDIGPDWGLVSHVRLSIHSSSDNWVILSEIHLKVAADP